MALDSENLGMIESAILNIMKLKYHYPDYNYSSLIDPATENIIIVLSPVFYYII